MLQRLKKRDQREVEINKALKLQLEELNKNLKGEGSLSIVSRYIPDFSMVPFAICFWSLFFRLCLSIYGCRD